MEILILLLVWLFLGTPAMVLGVALCGFFLWKAPLVGIVALIIWIFMRR